MAQIIQVVLGILLFSAGTQETKKQDPHAPPKTKIDMERAISITKDYFKGEQDAFIKKVELKLEEGPSAPNTTDIVKRWVWKVTLVTRHGNHWGPAAITIHAQSGKVFPKQSHLHK